MAKHNLSRTAFPRLLVLLGLLALVSCGTFQISLGVQNTSLESEFSEAPGYVFADNAVFLGYRVSELWVSPGGELILELYWELDEAPGYSYTVGIRLVGERNAPPVWQHSDNSVHWMEGYQVTHHRLRFASQIDAGSYGVEIWLQHPVTGEREAVSGPDGPIAARVVSLMTLRVTDEGAQDETPQIVPDIVPVSTSVESGNAAP